MSYVTKPGTVKSTTAGDYPNADHAMVELDGLPGVFFECENVKAGFIAGDRVDVEFSNVVTIRAWKVAPAANCPGLPVNDERNEG